jgi:predicted HTH domain antitoxin
VREPPSTRDDGGELTSEDAARILGCRPEEVSGMLDDRAASLEYVEELALEHYRWRAHVDDPQSYWVTLKQAAAILGVSPQRVKNDLAQGLVPFVVHRDGVRLMRREQLEAAGERPDDAQT